MGLSNFFRFGSIFQDTETELPVLFPLHVTKDFFVANDVFNVYSKILTDVIERTSGIPESSTPLLWDNCLQNEAPDGLITLLADAMTNKSNLYLIYVESLGLLRTAYPDEEKQIEAVYEKVSAKFPELLHPNLSTVTVRPWGAKEFAIMDGQIGIVFQQW